MSRGRGGEKRETKRRKGRQKGGRKRRKGKKESGGKEEKEKKRAREKGGKGDHVPAIGYCASSCWPLTNHLLVVLWRKRNY